MKRILIGLMVVLFASVASFAGTTKWDTLYLTEDLELLNDQDVQLGTDANEQAFIQWTTGDANAECLLAKLPAQASNAVPVFLIGQKDDDYGYFDGVTETTVAIEDTDGDSWLTLDFSADDTPRIAVGGGASALTLPSLASVVIDDGDADVTVDSDDQTDASAAINVPDFSDATADFLVTNVFTTILPFNGGLAGEDTDGTATNGGGMVGSTVDITTHDYNSGGTATDDVLCKAYHSTTTTWDDISTTNASLSAADYAADYQLLPDPDAETTDDAFAVGFDEKFTYVVFNDLATASGALATWAGDGGKWQYSTGAGTWSDLTVFDNTDSTAQDGKRPLQQTGAITFADPGAGWVKATYDGEEAYWIQYVITAAQLTQAPVIDTTNKDEPIVGIPTSDSFQAPYKLEIVDVRVTNMNATVHDQIIKFVVGNFTDGVFSSELSWTASQYNDKFALGTAIAADADDIIGIVVTDDAGSTNNPIWAVEFEVTYED